MAAATSATVTVDPPAVKKRGRPRKVVDESAVAPEKVATRKVSTRAKTAPKAKSMEAMKEKKKTLTRVSDYKAKKGTPAPKAAPGQTNTVQQATPATPTSSKILDEVKATGTFSKSSAPPPTKPKQPPVPPVPGPAPVAPVLPAEAEALLNSNTTSSSVAPPSTEPHQPFVPPVPGPAPVAPVLPAAATAPFANPNATRSSAAPPETPSSPVQQPVDEAVSRPVIPRTASAPSERANIIPPKPRATTIPLPHNPLTAPSPVSGPPKSRVAFAEPAPRASPRAPPRAPRYPTRLIEPLPDTKLPPKYKKAARQVTSIIVGIPIIIVVGYDLYGRWKSQINTKFEERAKRDPVRKELSG